MLITDGNNSEGTAQAERTRQVFSEFLDGLDARVSRLEATTTDRINELEAHISVLEGYIGSLEVDNIVLDGDKTALEARVAELHRENTRLVRRAGPACRCAEARIAELTGRVNDPRGYVPE